MLSFCLKGSNRLKLFKIYLILTGLWWQMWQNFKKKRENAQLEKISRFLFCTFFFSVCPDVILNKVSTDKKARKCTGCIFFTRIKSVFLHQDYLVTVCILKLIFFFCSVQGARWGSQWKFLTSQRIIKHC